MAPYCHARLKVRRRRTDNRQIKRDVPPQPLSPRCGPRRPGAECCWEHDAIASVLVDVIGLLAKQELRVALEQVTSRQAEDAHSSAPPRRRKKQRRLGPDQVAELVVQFVEGISVVKLALEFDVNRTTVLAILEREGIPRRACARRLTDEDVENAARYYIAGESLATVGTRFGVAARTIQREFRRSGIQTRPRPGM